jgi:hypothetical protein
MGEDQCKWMCERKDQHCWCCQEIMMHISSLWIPCDRFQPGQQIQACVMTTTIETMRDYDKYMSAENELKQWLSSTHTSIFLDLLGKFALSK